MNSDTRSSYLPKFEFTQPEYHNFSSLFKPWLLKMSSIPILTIQTIFAGRTNHQGAAEELHEPRRV